MSAAEPVTTLTHTDTHVPYRVCESCGPAISNDDWTHLDFHFPPDEADKELSRLHAWLDLVGWLFLVGPYDGGGYWDCDCCDATTIGAAWVFEGERGRWYRPLG